MKLNSHVIVIGLAVVFGVVRLGVSPHDPTFVDVYKDLVHVYMGVVGTLAWRGDRVSKYVFWMLSALEVIVATVSRL